jgi:hypothetical protein
MPARLRAFTQLYQEVAVEMGMPPRGLKGSEANIRRHKMASAVLQETWRRWRQQQRRKNSAANTPARPDQVN